MSLLMSTYVSDILEFENVNAHWYNKNFVTQICDNLITKMQFWKIYVIYYEFSAI